MEAFLDRHPFLHAVVGLVLLTVGLLALWGVLSLANYVVTHF